MSLFLTNSGLFLPVCDSFGFVGASATAAAGVAAGALASAGAAEGPPRSLSRRSKSSTRFSALALFAAGADDSAGAAAAAGFSCSVAVVFGAGAVLARSIIMVEISIGSTEDIGMRGRVS